jgi:FeS assembly SUF system protein
MNMMSEEKTEIQEEEVRSLEERVMEQIKSCFDPEIPVNIHELGLIYSVKIEHNDVNVQMTLTSPSCPSAEALPSEVETKIRSLADVNDVKVEVVFDPPWEMSMMSEAAKLELGFW